MNAYEDVDNEGNSSKYWTGKTCIEPRCKEHAGTAWSPFWCFRHNVERMNRITHQLEDIVASFPKLGEGG